MPDSGQHWIRALIIYRGAHCVSCHGAMAGLAGVAATPVRTIDKQES